MDKEQKRLNFRIPLTLYEKLDKLATKRGCNLSEAVRDMLERQLIAESLKADEEMIRKYIRLELEPIIEKYMNRLISISVKGSSTSASSMILLAKTLECFVAPHHQEEFNETFNMSRKAGLEYLRLRDSDIEDFIDRT